jgi:hypothetical protein
MRLGLVIRCEPALWRAHSYGYRNSFAVGDSEKGRKTVMVHSQLTHMVSGNRCLEFEGNWWSIIASTTVGLEIIFPAQVSV